MKVLLFLLMLLGGSGIAQAQSSIPPISSSAIEGSHVFCQGACKLYSLSVTSGASAGFVMVFDTNADPANGTLTSPPKYCWNWPASTGQGYLWPLGNINGPPSGAQFVKGLTVVYSTGADCLNKTESATAFFTVQVQ